MRNAFNSRLWLPPSASSAPLPLELRLLTRRSCRWISRLSLSLLWVKRLPCSILRVLYQRIWSKSLLFRGVLFRFSPLLASPPPRGLRRLFQRCRRVARVLLLPVGLSEIFFYFRILVFLVFR